MFLFESSSISYEVFGIHSKFFEKKQNNRFVLISLLRYNLYMEKKPLTQEECYSLLEKEQTPAKVIRHCCRVSEVATLLGQALNRKGLDFDLDLIRVSGMLHDIARAKDEHWNVGAEILQSLGYPKEAYIIKHHMSHTPTTRLGLLTELDLICLADRTVLEDKFVGLDKRMDYVLEKAKKFPDAIPIILAKKTITQDIIKKIEGKINMTLGELVEKGNTMDLNQAIKERHSIRKFKNDEVPDDHIKEIIAAAGSAPSGENHQNWHFVAIKSHEWKEKIQKTIRDKNETMSLELDKIDQEKGLRFRKFCKNFTLFATEAPVLVLVFAKESLPPGYAESKMIGADEEVLDDLLQVRNPGMQNIGAAIQNFSLKAVELGYGSCWLSSGNYAGDEIEGLLKEAGIFNKEGYFMVAMMALGLAEGQGRSPRRKELEEILTLVK